LGALLGNLYKRPGEPRQKGSQEDQLNSLNWQSAQEDQTSFDNWTDVPIDAEELGIAPIESEDIVESYDSHEQERMDFALDHTRITRVEQLQQDVRKWEGIIEVLPFWRMPINSINISLSVITVIGSALLIYLNLNNLPEQIPLFYSQAEGNWQLVSKPIFALLPVGLAMFDLLLIRSKGLIFNFDRRLSAVLASAQSFFNILGFIALVQIISLLLV
jgi:hypothetical protein